MRNGIETIGNYRILKIDNGYLVQKFDGRMWVKVEHYDYLSNARMLARTMNQKDDLFKVGNILKDGGYFVMVTEEYGNEDTFCGTILISPYDNIGLNDDGWERGDPWVLSSLQEVADAVGK